MNKNIKIVWYIAILIILVLALIGFSNYTENTIIEKKLENYEQIITFESDIENKKVTTDIVKVPNNTKGIPQGTWTINGEVKTTKDIMEELVVGQSWGAINNITDREYNRIKSMEQYMGYTEHIDNREYCFYKDGYMKRIDKDVFSPYYHQGLFGKEEWGEVVSGTSIGYPDSSSTFNKNGCHIYTLAYALSRTKNQLINPPEALVLGWYCGFWNNGMGPTENVKNLNKYLGINAVTVNDDKENGKKEVDAILDKKGVVIIYVTKPFSFGNYHWICITDRINDNGVDKYKIWTSTNMAQNHQVYTFDYLYSKRVFEDWIRVGIMPNGEVVE